MKYCYEFIANLALIYKENMIVIGYNKDLCINYYLTKRGKDVKATLRKLLSEWSFKIGRSGNFSKIVNLFYSQKVLHGVIPCGTFCFF